MKDKIKTEPELKVIVESLKKHGKRIVFTNGCFDIIHYGHVKYLEDCKACGDVLVLGLNSDSSVKKIKGNSRPIMEQYDRARILSAFEAVDYITIFDEETPIKLIEIILPDVLAKGGDWDKKDIVGNDIVSVSGGKVITVPYIKGRSTSGIIDKIKKIVST